MQDKILNNNKIRCDIKYKKFFKILSVKEIASKSANGSPEKRGERKDATSVKVY